MFGGMSGQRQQQKHHYDWLSGYLAARGLSAPVRITMAALTMTMTISVGVLLVAEGLSIRLTAMLMALSIAGGILCSCLWVWRWPTRRQSVAFALVANAGTVAACLTYPQPLPALAGCITFATIGAYIAFFHTVRLIAYNFGVAAIVAVVTAGELAISGQLAIALVILWLVVQINVLMPVAIQVLVHALGGDLVGADRDPLTGLFNLRAFRDEALGMILSRRQGAEYLHLAVVDLDDFKAINDEFGHAAGDLALVQTAQTLGAAAPGAIPARTGGEEFVVAAVSSNHNYPELSQELCAAIAGFSAGRLTASVGTASAPLHGVHVRHLLQLIDELAVRADDAMYRAKRAGGNQCHHHQPPD